MVEIDKIIEARKKAHLEELKAKLTRAKTPEEFDEFYKEYLKLADFENYKAKFIPQLAKQVEEEKTKKMNAQIERIEGKIKEIEKLGKTLDDLNAKVDAIQRAPSVSSATREGVPATPVGKALMAWHEGGKTDLAWEEAERFLEEYKKKAGIT